MPTHNVALDFATALLQPATRNYFLMEATSLILASSQFEGTVEVTNRICDRYFPLSGAEASK